MKFVSAFLKLKNRSIQSPVGVRKMIVAAIAFVALAGCASNGINRSTGEFVDDVSMSARIKSAMLADGTTDGLDIEVEAFRGRIQLIGFADSQAEISRAEQIARNTEGVSSVANLLQVVSASRRVGEYIDDTVLVARITAALTRDPTANKINMEIEANRGVVILGGFVDSVLERDAAERVTANVDGVDRVINGLELR